MRGVLSRSNLLFYRHRQGPGLEAISTLSLEELRYFDERRKKDKKDEVPEEGTSRGSSKNTGEEE
ncbi:MAG: hypothetical protein WBD99_06405 [Thermodesulfobacteriota bacterium]